MHACEMNVKEFKYNTLVIAKLVRHLAFEGDLEAHKQQADALNDRPI